MAHKRVNWLPHPCRIGDPHRFRAGGKIRSGPQVGKLATSPLPYRGSPPLQSAGQNQKWPTSGQIGYLTPAVSGSPTASERGAKSEVAHKWANWLPHPCRIGDPHRFRAGGKIRSGPQVGKLATSPLPYRGAPPLQSGGQNQKWPTSGQIGYLTPAVSGSPTASERGAKSEVAHKWANWLPHPCRIGDPHRFRAGGKIRSGPQVGKLATSPLPYRGAPPLQSGGQNQKWPTSGQIGYLTPAVSGSPTASERGAKSEVAHKWARPPFFSAVNACNKKTVRSCNLFFFAVSRVSRLTRLTAEKKNYTTIRFFCYAHLQRKKITRITTYTSPSAPLLLVGLGNSGFDSATSTLDPRPGTQKHQKHSKPLQKPLVRRTAPTEADCAPPTILGVGRGRRPRGQTVCNHGPQEQGRHAGEAPTQPGPIATPQRCAP